MSKPSYDDIVLSLEHMADAYDEKRSDVATIIRDILIGEGFDPNKVEHRFAQFKYENEQENVIIVYDTLTTLFEITDPELNTIIEGTSLVTWYGNAITQEPELDDPVEEEDRVLGQITVKDVDELTGDIITSILPSLSEKAHDALYDIVHNELMARWRDK
jgi:hypothetical protein